MNSCEKKIIDPFAPIDDVVTVTKDITENMTWEAKYLYVVEKSPTVKNNATLTIEAGTIIKFKGGTSLGVGYASSDAEKGTLKAMGTELKPILFTSYGDVKAQDDWAGIKLNGGANTCELNYCIIEYAGSGSNFDTSSLLIRANNVSVIGCTITNSIKYGIYVYGGSFNNFTKNTFSNNKLNAISFKASNIEQLGILNSYEGNIEVRGGEVTTSGDVVWKNQNTDIIIEGDVMIGSLSGTKLIIKPGCTYKFTGGGLGCGTDESALIEAKGTLLNPITFTSASISPYKGDWNGLWFDNNSANGSILEYCNFSYGGGANGDNKGNIVFQNGQGEKVSIRNCSFNYSEGYGLFLRTPNDTSYPILENNAFLNNELGNKNW